jgi:ER-bound oxygenase mpaB/B'/Rubber oxygenase, catalytic domain
MSAETWTEPFLDEMRNEGDPLADEAVAALFAEGDVDRVNHLLRAVVMNDGAPPSGLPPALREYLARTAALPEVDAEKAARGEELFGVYGPEMLMVLGFYGLPADYAARKGAQVLHCTGLLLGHPVRRLFETTQMVVDVMARGGLGHGGRGVRSAQKVRLMHAAVRYRLTRAVEPRWDASLGVPINQEDLAGTLMTFSYMVLDGLERLGIDLEPADREAYLHAWQVIGRIMGVREDLIPADVAAARELTRVIHGRQIAPSSAGRDLANALVTGYQQLLPGFLEGVPASLIHFFLDRDPFDGQNVAELLGVPSGGWSGRAVRLAVKADAILARSGLKSRIADKALGYVNRHIIEGMLLFAPEGKRAPFTLPDELRSRWNIGTPAIAA